MGRDYLESVGVDGRTTLKRFTFQINCGEFKLLCIGFRVCLMIIMMAKL
jgi:hypothetical protein